MSKVTYFVAQNQAKVTSEWSVRQRNCKSRCMNIFISQVSYEIENLTTVYNLKSWHVVVYVPVRDSASCLKPCPEP